MSKHKGKVLLITGGTGSFGNTVLRYFLENTEIQEIRVFSRDEKKQDDMRHKLRSDRVTFHIGDTRDLQSVKNSMYGVNYVFHAAALKQVPSCEFFPLEAVKTNVLGTENVLNACIDAGVERVICLSTDKAAYPVNAMGISKAMMEKVFVAKARTVSASQTIICGTRYGNVIGSRGSVVPLFIEQIKAGKPLTVTDSRMTRFIMSLDQAVGLVMFAFEHGDPGSIMVQKSPSCTIGTLAHALKDIFGASNPIVEIGVRHGEKMFEVLLTREEAARAMDLGQFYSIPADDRDLNYAKYLEDGSPAISVAQEYTSDNTQILGLEEVKAVLLAEGFVQRELAFFQGREG